MLSFLPTIHKNFVLKMGLIFIITIFTVIILVSFWHFIPFFTGQPQATTDQPSVGSILSAEYSFVTNPKAGSDWIIEVKLENEGILSAHGIEVQVLSDDVINGNKEVVGTLLSGKTREVSIQSSIKENVTSGPHKVQIVTISSGVKPYTKELLISIQE